jgi:hypothetical protein
MRVQDTHRLNLALRAWEEEEQEQEAAVALAAAAAAAAAAATTDDAAADKTTPLAEASRRCCSSSFPPFTHDDDDYDDEAASAAAAAAAAAASFSDDDDDDDASSPPSSSSSSSLYSPYYFSFVDGAAAASASTAETMRLQLATCKPQYHRRSPRTRRPKSLLADFDTTGSTRAVKGARGPQPAAATTSALSKEYKDIDKAADASRWCLVEWEDEPDPPTGISMFLMNPGEYSTKHGLGHWRVFSDG